MNRLLALLLTAVLLLSAASRATEAIWIEAETLDGIEGYCWPAASKPCSRP